LTKINLNDENDDVIRFAYRCICNCRCECQKMWRWRSCQERHHVSRSPSLFRPLPLTNLTITPHTVRYRASRRPAVCHCSVPSFTQRHPVLGDTYAFSSTDKISCVFVSCASHIGATFSTSVNRKLQNKLLRWIVNWKFQYSIEKLFYRMLVEFEIKTIKMW